MKKLFSLIAAFFLCAAAFAQKGTLIIDAGHGGTDNGAIAATGTAEKAYNLQLAQAVQKEAIAAGYTVVMTREDDSYPSLEARAALRDKFKGANVRFISLHTDASPSDTVKGLTIHYDPKTAGLTTTWRQKLATGLQTFGNVRTEPVGLAVLRGSTIPALSVSPGFISNMQDFALISDPGYQEKVAKIIVNSLK